MPLSIGGSTGITGGPNGSAAAPAFAGADATTGMFFNTSYVGISTGGNSAVVIDSGNVQLATANKVIKNSSGSVILQQTGSILQIVNVQTTALASTAVVIPNDDTIPQNTEGAELFTLSITPTSATSKLLISAIIQAGPNPAAWMSIALFQDSVANAIAATILYQGVATGASILPLNYYMTAGTTSATTFKLRYGPGGAQTMYVNSIPSTRVFGGVCVSSMTITEIAA